VKRVLLVVIAIVVTGCVDSNASGTEYDLYEFSIDGSSTLTTGAHNLTITNSGEFSHTFVITNDVGEVVAASDVIPSGGVTDLSADLEAGAYRFTCRIVAQTEDGELVDHFERGMNLTVQVTASP
jgi:hypothetical protein